MKVKTDIAIVVLLTILSAVLRLDLLIASKFIIDSDEAIVGLMAKHIIEGGEIPTFYYGQHYMGSLEPLSVALMFKLFGISEVILKLTPLLFSVAITPLIYSIAARLAGVGAGRVAALLWAIPPSPLVIWSSMARGGFIEVIFLIGVGVWLSIDWFKASAPNPLRTAAIAFVLGVGWWVNNQIIYLIAPLSALMLLHLLVKRITFTRILFHGVIGILSAIVGSLPFWIYNLQNNWASFGIFGRATSEEMGKHFIGTFNISLPMLVGAKRFWQMEDSWFQSTFVLSAVFGILLIISLYLLVPKVRLSEKNQDLWFKFLQRSLMWGIIATAIGAFISSNFGHLVTAPRYLLPIYLPLFILVADAIVYILRLNRALGLIILSVVMLSNLASSYAGGRAVPGQPYVAFNQRAAADHSRLISWLKERDYKLVETNYWIGYRLAFESREAIKFVQFQEPFQVRIDSYEDLRERTPRRLIPIILVPKQAAFVENALKLSGFVYERNDIGGYVILSDVHEKIEDLNVISPELYTISTDPAGSGVENLSDGKLSTRWGSASPQAPGMYIKIDFSKPTHFRGLRYDLGKFATDFPRGMEIYINDSTSPLFSQNDYRSVRYLLHGEHHFEFVIDPITVSSIKIVQTGSDTFFDWSMAELQIFG